MDLNDNHTCSNKNSTLSEDLQCHHFIKQYLQSQSDVEFSTIQDLYDRVIHFALVQHSSDYTITHWPGRESLLIFIKRLRQKMRPPYKDITLETKAEFEFPESIKTFETENIFTCLEDNKICLFYWNKSIRYLADGNNERISIDGTGWSYIGPIWCQVLVICATIKMKNNH